ncbi:MAG TPA: glycosyltransferase [Actinomycetota bacterium]|nr:glycosyltransferase [Actinomycetota bacterium]
MKVLQVLAQSAGGIGRHVAALVAGLDGEKDLEFEIAADPTIRMEMPRAPRPVVIPPGLRRHRPAINHLERLIRESEATLVHAHGLRAAVDAGVAARRVGRPLIFTAHNVIHPMIAGRLKAPVLGQSERLALRLATRVIAPSEEIKRHLVARRPAAAPKITTIYLGAGSAPVPQRAPDDVRRELAVGARRVGATVARLAPQKALHVLLDAWRRIPGQPVLAVVGEGPLEASLKSMARDMGVAERVRWVGWQADPASYVAAADVFCLSSVWEAVALAAQEAVALGTPVVTTDAGGMRELIEDRVTGRLVRVGDAAALAAAIDEVLSDPQAGERYAAAARARLDERFSHRGMLDRVAALYREVAHA